MKPALTLLFILLLATAILSTHATETRRVDVCVYGATPAGIAAAVTAKQEGCSALIVEPGRWVGGILGAGLKPLQDCPKFEVTGGLTRQWLLKLGSPNWDGSGHPPPHAVRVCPRAVREDFQKILDEHEIPVVFDHRVVACEMRATDIVAAVFDLAPFDDLGCPAAEPNERAALRVEARVFIDAGYEGDLMHAAGVTTRIGREADTEFDEAPYAGASPIAGGTSEIRGAASPRVTAPIDPFVVPGDRSSGLLKWVEGDHRLPSGSADQYTQAYNYRYYTTTDPERRAPITPPPGYDPQDFELVGRYVAYLKTQHTGEKELFQRLSLIFPGWMNAGEWNFRRDMLFTMAPVGVSHLYAGGDYAEKARIWKMHQDYLRGLHTFMSSDTRVPEGFRKKTAALGLDRLIHPDTQGWPHQLYIRVARRLDGEYTITAHDVAGRRANEVTDPVGLAAYALDTYPARRYWFEQDGQVHVAVEGAMMLAPWGQRGIAPYPVSYRAITPKRDECTNLLVPVLFSASHLGYASARMEPTFMILGESAGVAAAQAIRANVPVQKIDFRQLRDRLLQRGQILDWTDEQAQQTKQRHKHGFLAGEWGSRQEWDDAKPGWEWLFDAIDVNEDGRVSPAEYRALQDYKQKDKNWATTLKTKTLAEALQTNQR